MECCLDTGVLISFFGTKISKEITALKRSILQKKIKATVVFPILNEFYYHICKDGGRDTADILLAQLFENYPLNMVQLNKSMVLKAGLLKCQHGAILSYNDCSAIAYALNHNVPFYTTEKNLKKTLPRLKIKTFNF